MGTDMTTAVCFTSTALSKRPATTEARAEGASVGSIPSGGSTLIAHGCKVTAEGHGAQAPSLEATTSTVAPVRAHSCESGPTPRTPSETVTPKTAVNRVFVLDRDGKALDPCTPKRARVQVKRGRARWTDKHPNLSVIRMRDGYAGESVVHGLELRVDLGVKWTGLALMMMLENTERCLWCIVIEHRSQEVTERLKARAAFRRGQRYRIGFRTPRFDNRRRPEGWFPPSVESATANIVTWAKRIAKRCEVVSACIESARFDVHKLKNPDVEGEGYQYGRLWRSNAREACKSAARHRCVYCSATKGRFTLDHVIAQGNGGVDAIGNLVGACAECNQKKGAIPVEVWLDGHPDALARVRKAQDAVGRVSPYPGRMTMLSVSVPTKLGEALGIAPRETDGAHTAWRRRMQKVTKTHANDAAFAASTKPLDTLCRPARWKAVGRGRRKQIIPDKHGTPRGKAYRQYAKLSKSERKSVQAPGHRRRSRHALGVRSGDTVAIRIDGRYVEGTAIVNDTNNIVMKVRNTEGKEHRRGTARPENIRRIRCENGYRRQSRTKRDQNENLATKNREVRNQK